MINREEFLSEIGFYLLHDTNLELGDVLTYVRILRGNPCVLDQIVDNYEGEFKYIQTNEDEYGSNGQVVVNEYKIELCCYGDFAINIYKNDEYIEMIRDVEEVEIEVEHDKCCNCCCRVSANN